jgi:hypothetical protein
MTQTTQTPRLTRAQKKARHEQLRVYRLACALGMPAQCSRNPSRSVAMGRHVMQQVLGHLRRRK